MSEAWIPPDPDVSLELEREIRIVIPSPGQVRIRAKGEWILLGARALSILEAFQHPRTFREVLQELGARSRGAQDWVYWVNTVSRLHHHGILRPTAQIGSEFPSDSQGFDSPFIHVRMLNDGSRVRAYVKAISEVVRAGHVVVDIGTGTGVLAVAAARAGAERVYAIEATSMLRRAQGVFERNGVGERSIPVGGWSSNVELPERADVVISETFGGDPLEEGAREILDDAVRRFMATDGLVIPRSLTIWAVPVTVPENLRDSNLFTTSNLEAWRRAYEIDFSSLGEETGRRLYRADVHPVRARDWTAMADPVRLVDFLFIEGGSAPIDVAARFDVNRDGELGGILIYFDLELSPSVSLSTKPEVADERCSWTNAVWFTAEPWKSRSGDAFEVVYRTHPEPGQGRVELRPLKG